MKKMLCMMLCLCLMLAGLPCLAEEDAPEPSEPTVETSSPDEADEAPPSDPEVESDTASSEEPAAESEDAPPLEEDKDGDVEAGDGAEKTEESADDGAEDPEEPTDAPEEDAGEGEEGAEEEGEEGAEERYDIDVSPCDFPEGEWINEPPLFTLSGIPEDRNWTYAVIVYDDRIIPLSGDAYAPKEDGVCTLQFAIQDELGDFLAVSDKFTLWFDWTKPKVTIEASKDQDYALNITATDALSGVASISMDGGKTWHSALDGAIYTYTGDTKATLPAGQIRVMDRAGNVYSSEKSYTLAAVKSTAKTASGSANKSSSGTSSGTSSHASDSDEDADADGMPELTLPDGPMRQLIIDDQTLALTLTLEAEGETRRASFTGALEAWYTPEGKSASAPNLLALDADVDGAGDVFTCRWRVNGEVLRLLDNSGVDYIAFRALDDVCVVPTAGFIGGTKYTELKMQGVSTRQFDYELTMKVNRDINVLTALSDDDFSEDCDFALRVEVEDMAYELSSSHRNAIYYYDVYLGPADMLSAPLGKYEA